VGDIVGLSVGDTVGLLVGERVGEGVGCVECFSVVGNGEGERVGLRVVVDRVGLPVGEFVGDLVGVVEGVGLLVVVVLVGFPVGTFVGLRVGDFVGGTVIAIDERLITFHSLKRNCNSISSKAFWPSSRSSCA